MESKLLLMLPALDVTLTQLARTMSNDLERYQITKLPTTVAVVQKFPDLNLSNSLSRSAAALMREHHEIKYGQTKSPSKLMCSSSCNAGYCYLYCSTSHETGICMITRRGGRNCCRCQSL